MHPPVAMAGGTCGNLLSALGLANHQRATMPVEILEGQRRKLRTAKSQFRYATEIGLHTSISHTNTNAAEIDVQPAFIIMLPYNYLIWRAWQESNPAGHGLGS